MTCFPFRRRAFRGLALLALAANAPPPARPGPHPPRRIVSMNLCADQLVAAFADRDQIAGLTEWARDPGLSWVAARARTLPVAHQSAEAVIASRPDLVIGAPPRTAAILAPLQRRGVRLLDLPFGDSYPALEAAVATVAAAVGHPERGRAAIAAMRRTLAAAGPPPGRGRVAAYYQRDGFLSGADTLVDDMLRRVGLRNLSRRLGGDALPRLGVEEMALARPDFLVMDTGAQARGDRGSRMLRHPLLTRAVPPGHRLLVPQALTVCATPAFPRAVAMLAAQVRAADARDGR